MFDIVDKGNGVWTASHTRGDSAEFKVRIVVEADNGDLVDYEMASGDMGTITLRRTTKSEIVLQKNFVGSSVIKLDPSDTEDLDVTSYKFDIQLDTESGDRYTFNRGDKSTWKLLDEVTY